MKKLIATAAAVGLGFVASANAAVIDFANYADTFGERGTQHGETLTVDGINVSLFAINSSITSDLPDANPYLDAGNAGLGLCSTGLTQTGQCVVPSDDNVTEGEGVGVLFEDGLFDIDGFVFRAANHAILGDAPMITIATGVGSMIEVRTDTIGAFLALAAAGDAFFSGIDRIGFGFAGTQFYVSSLDVSAVPVPAAGLLFLTGVAGTALARKKRSVAKA